MASNEFIKPDAWRAKGNEVRKKRAELLRLPSGATILAAKPEPLEWILAGRLPQRLLAGALGSDGQESMSARADISRDDILELARFATQLVRASVVEPPIGEGPGEIALDDIPVEDRAFIFEWACRSLGQSAGDASAGATASHHSSQEDLSSAPLERFRQK